MRVASLLLCAVLVGCGGGGYNSPTSPSPTPTTTPAPAPAPPPLSLGGSWSNVATYSLDGQNYRAAGSASVTQNVDALTGTWSADTFNGTIDARFTGTPTATLDGTLTVSAASTNPGTRCAATSPITGTATATSMQVLVGLVNFPACDSVLRNFTLTLSR